MLKGIPSLCLQCVDNNQAMAELTARAAADQPNSRRLLHAALHASNVSPTQQEGTTAGTRRLTAAGVRISTSDELDFLEHIGDALLRRASATSAADLRGLFEGSEPATTIRHATLFGAFALDSTSGTHVEYTRRLSEFVNKREADSLVQDNGGDTSTHATRAHDSHRRLQQVRQSLTELQSGFPNHFSASLRHRMIRQQPAQGSHLEHGAPAVLGVGMHLHDGRTSTRRFAEVHPHDRALFSTTNAEIDATRAAVHAC